MKNLLHQIHSVIKLISLDLSLMGDVGYRSLFILLRMSSTLGKNVLYQKDLVFDKFNFDFVEGLNVQ